jgi:hypothetical protein
MTNVKLSNPNKIPLNETHYILFSPEINNLKMALVIDTKFFPRYILVYITELSTPGLGENIPYLASSR